MQSFRYIDKEIVVVKLFLIRLSIITSDIASLILPPNFFK